MIPFDQAFFQFEVEDTLQSLKDVPVWDELEAMLDNPYAMTLDTEITGSYPSLNSGFAGNYYYQGFPLSYNYQGFPGYRSTLPRRRSFIYRDAAGNPCPPGTPGCNEVPLSPHLVHPLNYNYLTGEELRLLNINFGEADWEVPDEMVVADPPTVLDPTGVEVPSYTWTYRTVTVSAGADRIDPDEAVIDYNSPVKPDTEAGLFSPEPILAPGTPQGGPVSEGQWVTGRDPGEPGYLGFGTLGGNANSRRTQYSVPALPLADGAGGVADVALAQRNSFYNVTPGLGTANRRLYDPARGFITARNPNSGVGGLRKPSLRVPPIGNANNPGYHFNSVAALAPDPAALHPSSENDYIRPAGATVAGIPTGRGTAAALGKALFWDMQVGSDAVQSCGSCHAHAGADDRTRNQVNPNHLGGDVTFQVRQPNEELVASDFPFHKLINPSIVAESTATPHIEATLFDGSTAVVADGANFISDVNDVASSMGVVFHNFLDIPAIGTFTPASAGVASVLPDLGEHVPDPIPGFNGPDGLSAIRRVEPRNTPTIFGVTMNFDNFWDGRARHDFNGGSVFGAADPQHHVFVNQGGSLLATRQVIRFASLASLATGPGLSEFEMSFLGRNWQKIGKKLLQAGVTPLANQLVATNDSVLGPFSNQGGSLAIAAGRPTAPGKPGLAFTYPELIRASFYPALWNNTSQHLNGGYTDGRLPAGTPRSIIKLDDSDGDGNGDTVNEANTDDPFDHYVLAIAAGPAAAANTAQFTQMEANFSLFWGMSIHLWASVLIPDDAPIDRFYDANPSAFLSFGESNEKYLVPDLLNCAQTGDVEPCFREVGNFKRDPNVIAVLGCLNENCTNPERQDVPAGGTRRSTDPDPLFGMDLFLGSNLSLKNPLYRSFRCGECHASGTLTDHTVSISHQLEFNDWVPEFGEPGREVFPEPLGRSRVVSGFNLESEVNGNAQDAIERNIADFALDETGAPQGQALFDNGVYNIGVTPIGNDIARGGNDAFGWPLSLSALALKNLGGVDYTPGGHLAADGFALPDTPGIPLPNFDPGVDEISGGLFEETAQDQQLNPGFEEEPIDPQLPPHLAPWASNINVGDETDQDELFIGLNTLCREPILEGFVDTFGPFNPAATISENYNSALQPRMATWPVVNRANRFGSFKAPSLRNVELTGPYFHNGGNLTLRQQLDFYLRGGNFPFANSAHRDFLIANLNIEDEALGGVDPILTAAAGVPVPAFTQEQKEHAKESLIDFLLELTDERVAFERAPFDHPEIFLPLDGTAPMNTFGRNGFLANLANGMFKQVPASGQGGITIRLPNFLNVSSFKRTDPRFASSGATVSHYDH